MSRRSTLWMDDFDKDPVHAIILDDYGMPIGPQMGQPGLNHTRGCATPYVDVCASFVPLATVVLPAIQARSTVRPASWCNRAMALRNLPPVDLSRRGMACQSLADHYTQVRRVQELRRPIAISSASSSPIAWAGQYVAGKLPPHFFFPADSTTILSQK